MVILVANSALLGSAFAAIKIAVVSFSPLEIAAARTGIGALVLSFVLAWRRGEAPSPMGGRGRLLAEIALLALLGYALPFSLVSWAEQALPSAVAGLIMSSGPLFALLLSPLLSRDEGASARGLGGALLGLSGVMLVLIPRAGLAHAQADTRVWLHGLAVLAAALCHALAGFRLRAVRLAPERLTRASLLVAALWLLPLVARDLARPRPDITLPAVLCLLYLGIVPTALGYLVRTRQVVRHGYNFVSNTGYLVPVWSVAFGALGLGEPLHADTLVALAVVVTGIWLGRWRPSA